MVALVLVFAATLEGGSSKVRLERNGREKENALDSREADRDGGRGPPVLLLTSPAKAVHDLARLRTWGVVLCARDG